MGRETILFKSEEKKTASEIAETLRVIAERIEKGQMTLKTDAQEVVIDFPGQMVLEMKAEEEQGRKLKKSFEIELEWVPGEKADSGTSIL